MEEEKLEKDLEKEIGNAEEARDIKDFEEEGGQE